MSTVTGYTRTGAGIAGIAMAVLGLAGCQAGSATAGGAGSGTVVTTSASSSPNVSAPPTLQLPSPPPPAAAQTTAAAAPISSVAANPTPNACPSAVAWASYITSVGFDEATALDQITAEQAEGVCPDGAQVPTSYTLIGPPTNYDIFPGVQITGINSNGQQYSETWAQFAVSNLGEYGGFYQTTINQGVEVMTITELKQPQQ